MPRGFLARKALLSITSETSIADHALAEVSIFLSKVNINAIYIINKKNMHLYKFNHTSHKECYLLILL